MSLSKIAGVFLLLTGCAGTTPRVAEVSHRTITHTINAEEKAVFVRDPASRIRVEPQALPAGERRQEFFVRWTPATVGAVRFQYRQFNVPNTVREQAFDAAGRRSTTFRVHGDEFLQGGTVSAWRVSLWSDTTNCVAEMRSATW